MLRRGQFDTAITETAIELLQECFMGSSDVPRNKP
jgi:hypothetical protein